MSRIVLGNVMGPQGPQGEPGLSLTSCFGVCTTSKSTWKKQVDAPGFEMVPGARIAVMWTFTDDSNDISALSVNGGPSAEMWAFGRRLDRRSYSGSSFLMAGTITEFIYDGTRFVMVEDGSKQSSLAWQQILQIAAANVFTASITLKSPRQFASLIVRIEPPYTSTSTVNATVLMQINDITTGYINMRCGGDENEADNGIIVSNPTYGSALTLDIKGTQLSWASRSGLVHYTGRLDTFNPARELIQKITFIVADPEVKFDIGTNFAIWAVK